MEKETFSDDFKKTFLLVFTRELIRHSAKRDFAKLQRIIEIQEEKTAEKIPSSFTVQKVIPPRRIIEKKKIDERKISPQFFARPMTKQIPVRKPALIIPEPKLPSHLEYLKPVPTSVEIDLFKINPLIKDPAVRVIEGNPDENAVVTGAMGTKPSNIFLSKEDVDRVINKFSEVSKIPVSEGVYRVVVGNLTLSAVISDIIGSRFVIRKMIIPQQMPYPSQNQDISSIKKNFEQRFQF